MFGNDEKLYFLERLWLRNDPVEGTLFPGLSRRNKVVLTTLLLLSEGGNVSMPISELAKMTTYSEPHLRASLSDLQSLSFLDWSREGWGRGRLNVYTLRPEALSAGGSRTL